MTAETQTELVRVKSLSATAWKRGREHTLIRDVSFSIGTDEVVAIVGESGCGKSVTVQAMTKLLNPREIHVDGHVNFAGNDILAMDEPSLRRLRANEIGMIFQDPMSSLNPLLPIGYQLAETLRGQGVPSRLVRERGLELLAHVGISDVERRWREYPHELSGGMRQRVMIAMALMARPKLLIADEPTTALDVTIQAQILDLLASIRRENSLSILIITHDLGVVAELADRIIVMYAGQVIEKGVTREILDRPRHPYTKALLHTVPKPGARDSADRIRLQEIPGTVPDDITGLRGCAFADRCAFARPLCRRTEIELTSSGNSLVRCLFPADYEVTVAR